VSRQTVIRSFHRIWQKDRMTSRPDTPGVIEWQAITFNKNEWMCMFARCCSELSQWLWQRTEQNKQTAHVTNTSPSAQAQLRRRRGESEQIDCISLLDLLSGERTREVFNSELYFQFIAQLGTTLERLCAERGRSLTQRCYMICTIHATHHTPPSTDYNI
jgi:hypothetical protein